MTSELGMNLASVERVLELEQQLDGMERKVKALEKRAGELKSEVERLEQLRRELRAEIVPYVKGGEIVRNAGTCSGSRSGCSGRPRELRPRTADAGRPVPARRGDRPGRHEHGLPRHGTSLDRVVAVKVALDPLVEESPIYLARFTQEAKSAAAIGHPGVVTVYDAGAEGPTRFIVMEFVPGKSLADILKEERPLEPARAPISPRRSPMRSAPPTPPGSSIATSSRATSWSSRMDR